MIQRFHLSVDQFDLVSASIEQRSDPGLVLDDCLGELRNVVVLVLVKSAQHAHARVARLAVEPHCLVLVFSTLDVLLDLDVEQRMAARHLQ